MKHFSLSVLGLALATASVAQLNITEVGHLDYQQLRSSDLSNIWGYTDELGNEYALVGVNGENGEPGTGGFSVVNVTDPANPVEVFFTSGPNSIWREIKTWGDYAYITTEAEGGLLIVDLTPLPQSNVLPTTVFEGEGWITSHSLFIDENGHLYLNGSNRGNGGVIIYDLTLNPMAPLEIGEYDLWYVHDCFARGNILYSAHISDGFLSICDVSDPANPILMGTQNTPNNFTHNCWLDDTGDYLFTTDEVPDSYIGAYDVSDPSDILLLDKLQTNPGSEAIVHNTYWLNDFVVQSYYTEGVSIYDVTYPHNMVEIGHYDTSPFTGDGFNGAWGVYPFAPSGNLYVSDIEGGLYILGPTYTHACWLEGVVTNAQTTQPIAGATVEIVTTSAFSSTSFDGQYATGIADAGTYQLFVHAPGYVDQTVDNVQLVTNQVTVLDVALVPLTLFSYGGNVIEEGTNTPIEGATVQLAGSDSTFTATTDAAGAWSIPSMYGGSYALTVGHWGHHTVCTPASQIIEGSPAASTVLPVGYYDDFAVDLGWNESTDASTGAWVRGVPDGTSYQGDPCAPGVDVSGDCGTIAYVTGNGGGDAGTDDVDDGRTILTSPEFDVTGMSDPWVRYERWFFNDGGGNDPNDECIISLTNGTDTVTIETIDADENTNGQWVEKDASIIGNITPSATMRFIIVTADDEPGHLVEAGLDLFEVLPESPHVGVDAVTSNDGSFIAPVPNNGTFDLRDPQGLGGQVQLFDATGRSITSPRMLNGPVMHFDLSGAAGAYLLKVTRPDGNVIMHRVLVQR